MKRIIVCSILAFCISGCVPTYFGLSKEQWESLTPSQQAEVIKAYNEREAERQQAENERRIIEEQNAPLNNLIGVLGTAIPQQGKEKKNTTATKTCSPDGSHCTYRSTTRSSGWHVGP
ncbi:hypothetical protein [Legionella londiniensis]|uniref:Uncharacterized protein n=1 Tax=Legionella londiniensis TaxID=45068 RepID=A0A0W0VSI5_9GAMM|nr:hypothetical protein [Legionella londiniensis]KTD22981.1 hypothetical protein Llon_0371 [Legionella londiniensis]STX92910.1 Uncharacterised protein [Legionella londiniensis]